MAADKTVRNSVAVADPDVPANVIKPNADGSINVNATSTPGTLGQQTMAASAPVVIASNQSNLPTNLAAVGAAAISLGIKPRATALPVVLSDISSGEYETVAASQTAQSLGSAGAIGDYISGLLVTPATTSPGNVILLDDATSITVFAGGASSVSSLVPFFVPLGIYSVSGAWKVTTGANVSVIGIGNFT